MLARGMQIGLVMSYSFEDKDDYQFVTVSFRCYVKHAKIVDQAAKKAHKSVADYVRQVTLDWAASDIGVPAPDYSVLPRFTDTVEAVAKSKGMTKQQYLYSLAAEDIAKERAQAKGRTDTVMRRADVAAKNTDRVTRGSGVRKLG